MRTLRDLATRNLRQRKLRTLLSIAGVALGVALVFAALSVGLHAFLQSAQPPAARIDLQIVAAGGGYMDGSLLSTARTVPGLATVSPVLTLSGVVANDTGLALTLRGVDMATELQIHDHPLTAGRLPEQPGDVAVSAAWADSAGLALGQRLTLLISDGVSRLPLPANFTLVGLLRESGGGLSGEALTTLPSLSALYGDKLSMIEVRYAGARDSVADKTAKALRDALNQVGAPVSLLTSFQFDGILLINSFINAVMLVGGITILLTSAYLIFNTFAMTLAERRAELGQLMALGMTPAQARNSLITEALIVGALGVVAGLVTGAVFTLPVGWIVSSITTRPFEAAPLSPVAALVAALLGILITLLAVYPVARQAGAVSPLEMIFPTRRGKAPSFRTLNRIGAALILFAVIMIGVASLMNTGIIGTLLINGVLGQNVLLFGLLLLVPGLLARLFRYLHRRVGLRFGVLTSVALGNLARTPGRAAGTASALAIVVATTISMASLGSTIGKSQPSTVRAFLSTDFVLIPGGGSVMSAVGAMASGTPFVPDNPAFWTEADALRDRAFVGRLGFILAPEIATMPVFPGGVVTEIQEGGALDHRGAALTGGTLEEVRARFAAEPSVILSALVTQRDGLNVGDYVTLQAPNGPARFRIAAIEQRVMFNYLDWAQVEAVYGAIVPYAMIIRARPGFSAADIEADVNALGQRHGLQVVSLGQLLRDQVGLFDALGSAFGAIGLLTMVIAALGILGLMYTAVMERRRELGVLSAVGGTPGQVRRMILIESAVLGLCGMLPGLLLGIGLSALIGPMQVAADRAAGMQMFTGESAIPLVPVVASLIGAPLVAILAASIPARRAAKLEVVDALRYQ